MQCGIGRSTSRMAAHAPVMDLFLPVNSPFKPAPAAAL